MKKDANGIKITEKMYQMIERGIAREGGQSNFARRLGIAPMNISRWHHHGIDNKGGRYIAWTIFPVLREYFLQNREITADDPEYLTHTQQIVIRSNEGTQQSQPLTVAEKRLLAKYRELEVSMQKAILQMIDAMPPKKEGNK